MLLSVSLCIAHVTFFHTISFIHNAQLSSPKRPGSPTALLGNAKPDANQNRRALRVCLNCLLCH
ncbi:Uncharacterised protein [Vibrio cholerae]|nr:Uncharacterised protein [Vibrio cholerae]CSA96771.1 Uncharacterised protein [Vibrio cholerae]CSB08653.1 Uncharacterised protein [Vibrio cholerae]CSB09552.1 Uncharacterised protein [Vibrio cholerae]CSB19766.1 Uncharacterised protein [Vibrio cholerae]